MSPQNEEVTEQKNRVFDWLAKMTESGLRSVKPEGMVGELPPFQSFLSPLADWHNSHNVVMTSRLFSAPPFSPSIMVLIAMSKEQECVFMIEKLERNTLKS